MVFLFTQKSSRFKASTLPETHVAPHPESLGFGRYKISFWGKGLLTGAMRLLGKRYVSNGSVDGQKSRTTTWDVPKTFVNNGINYQPRPQLVFSPDFWLPSNGITWCDLHDRTTLCASVVMPSENFDASHFAHKDWPQYLRQGRAKNHKPSQTYKAGVRWKSSLFQGSQVAKKPVDQ